MAEKKPHACKNCGYYTIEMMCPSCNANNMVSEKPKGMAVIFNLKESKIAENISAKTNGVYALKY